MPTTPEIVLLAVVLGAYTVGTTLGFGTSILVLTFGGQFFSLDVLLPVVAPLNLTLSSYVAVRYRHQVLWRQLRRRILPLVGLGVPAGLALFSLRGSGWLRLAFGVFVVVLAALQLRLWARNKGSATLPLAKLPGAVLLSCGGVIHGLFTTGGPLIVYVLGREIDDKGAFRASLAAMFVPITVALLIDYTLVGLMTPRALRLLAMAAPAMLLGVWLGEQAHRRVDERFFKGAVWVLLLIGGLVLSARAGWALS